MHTRFASDLLWNALFPSSSINVALGIGAILSLAERGGSTFAMGIGVGYGVGFSVGCGVAGGGGMGSC